MASNRSLNLIDLGAQVGVKSSPQVVNLNNSSMHCIFNIADLSASQIFTLEVIAITESGAQYILFKTLPVNTANVYRFIVSPFTRSIPGIACWDFVPKKFYIKITPTLPAQSDTYSVDVELGLP